MVGAGERAGSSNCRTCGWAVQDLIGRLGETDARPFCCAGDQVAQLTVRTQTVQMVVARVSGYVVSMRLLENIAVIECVFSAAQKLVRN